MEVEPSGVLVEINDGDDPDALTILLWDSDTRNQHVTPREARAIAAALLKAASLAEVLPTA